MKRTKYPIRPILIVDDEPNSLKSLEMALRRLGINNTKKCQDSRNVIPLLGEYEFEVLLLDIVMPHVSGEEILAHASKEHPDVLVIMVSGVDEVDTAVRCMQEGAFDYILKPVKIDRLGASVNRAVEMRRLRRENASLTRRIYDDTLENPDIFSSIITKNKVMRSIFQYVEVVAEGREPVLITGETGSGKELFAQSVHWASRRHGEFVAVNVAGLDDNIFSDTLFGHKKGAFTGADRARSGMIEVAESGTLFLDEIGDLTPSSQIKLLRLLQEREYYPLGSDIPKPTDARIVVATHAKLEEKIQSGAFREDLYYRLKTHTIQIPPLRKRQGDIPLLLDFFLEKAATESGKKKPTYHPQLINLLKTYNFPGNVRELRSMVYDAVARHKSRMLSMDSFKAVIHNAGPGQREKIPESGYTWASDLKELPTLKEGNEILIDEAMKRAGNNQRLAAKMLGISHQALNKRLKRSGKY